MLPLSPIVETPLPLEIALPFWDKLLGNRISLSPKREEKEEEEWEQEERGEEEQREERGGGGGRERKEEEEEEGVRCKKG